MPCTAPPSYSDHLDTANSFLCTCVRTMLVCTEVTQKRWLQNHCHAIHANPHAYLVVVKHQLGTSVKKYDVVYLPMDD